MSISVALHRALVCHVVKEQRERHSQGKGGPAGCNEIRKAKKDDVPLVRSSGFPPNFLLYDSKKRLESLGGE